MIDMMTIAGTIGYRHSGRRRDSRTDEDRFYAEFGDNSLIRFGGWLTSLDLYLRKPRKAAVQSCGSCDRTVQATLLAPR